MEQQQPQAPQAQPPPNDGVGELVAKISSDLLALKEASPEAFGQLLESLVGEGQPQEDPSSGMSPMMAGNKGVPMSHGR